MSDTFSFPGLYIGTVMITDTEKRRVGVYIPKIMSALYNGDTQQYTVPTNNGLQNVSFSTNIKKQITKINFSIFFITINFLKEFFINNQIL